MADQKRWFKVWATITIDPHFQTMSLEDIGRWTLLGALTVSVGEDGVLSFPSDGNYLAQILRCEKNDLKNVIERIPNLHFEEGKNRYGDSTVTWDKWNYYQVDNTSAERMKTLRSKRREEKRREEKRREEENCTPTGYCPEPSRRSSVPPDPAPQKSEIDSDPETEPYLIKIPTHKFRTCGEEYPVTAGMVSEWVEAYPAVDVIPELGKIRAWCVSNPDRCKTKRGIPRFINAWLAKEQDRGSRKASAPPGNGAQFPKGGGGLVGDMSGFYAYVEEKERRRQETEKEKNEKLRS